MNCKSMGVLRNARMTLLTVAVTTLMSFRALAINPGTIEGHVSDGENYKALPAAKVELLSMPDSAVIMAGQTDANGKYALTDVAFGKYALRISGLSYRKQIVSDVEVSFQKYALKYGTTNLFPESKQLGEVSIFAYKLTGEMEDDKTIYTIKEKSSDIAQSGLDLLRQIPDAEVDFMTNEVKLAGMTNIQFQVNGKKVEKNYLMQLNPKLIDKIEVITNPGVKYDSDVDAVINVVLKKDMKYGISGRVNIEVPTSKIILSNNNASFDCFLKKVRLFVSGNFGMNGFDINGQNNRFATLGTNSLYQSTTGRNKNAYGGFSYGADYFINDNDQLNFMSSVRPKIPNSENYTTDYLYNNYTTAQSTHKQSTSKTNSYNTYYDYSLFYKHKFEAKAHELSMEASFNNFNSNNDNDYYEQPYQSDVLLDSRLNFRNQITDNQRKQTNLKTDYTYPITEKLKLSVGYNAYFNRTNNSLTYNLISSSAYDAIDYNEDRHTGYSNIAWTVGTLNLQTGVRYEMSEVHIIHNYDTTNNYKSFLPFASAQYKIGKRHTLRLNYRRSVQRPGINQLSPFNYRNDAFSQSIGNPQLQPAYVNRIEFSHRIQIIGPLYFNYQPYISFVNKGIRQVNLPMTDSVLQSKYSNVSNEKEFGITVSGSLIFSKWWMINPSYTYYKRQIEALPEYGINETQTRSAWRFNLSNQFILPKEWVIFIQYNYSAPTLNHQSTSQQQYMFVSGFYKAINKRFNVTAYAINPWNSSFVFSRTKTNTQSFNSNSWNQVKYDYFVSVRLGYNFNIGKEGKKVERQREADEDVQGKKSLF